MVNKWARFLPISETLMPQKSEDQRSFRFFHITRLVTHLYIDAHRSEGVNLGGSEFASTNFILEQNGKLLVGSIPCLRKSEVAPARSISMKKRRLWSHNLHNAECSNACPEQAGLSSPVPVSCQNSCILLESLHLPRTYQLPGFSWAGSRKLLIIPIMLYTDEC